MASDANDAQAQNAANADATQREASEYWGYLIKPDKCGTELFDRLLKGIADVISKNFDPGDSPDLTPSQIAAFYRAVGGNYDVLFIETPPTSISFIYRSLGAFHSLQPAPDDDGYSSPTIPALKKKGFVTWQTIQLLLGPEEHVPFLQNAVAQFDVVDPETGNIFPKVIPKDCLPDRPDDAMEAWYEGVASRLKREAEDDAAEKERGPRVRVEVDDHGPRTSSELSDDADERHAAAKYFADPLYRKSRVRPPFVRHFSKENRPYENDRDRGRLISSVRHMLNPFNRRKSVPGRYDDDDDDYSDNDATPVAPVPPPAPAPRYPSHKRPHPPRRESTPTDSDSDSDRPPSRRRTPDLRHRRSHDPPPSSHEYFPAYVDDRDRRYSHDVAPAGRKEDGPPPIYGPTKSPLFATHVAQIQAHNYYDRRPQMPQRTSYRAQPHVRYAAQLPDDRSDRLSPPYARDRDRDREYDRDRERDRDRDAYELPAGSRHRRKSEDYPREKDRGDSARASRSHERVRDEWDPRENRSGERDRDGARRTHRYVSGVQDGVGGRRYPVAEPWQR